MSVMEENVVDLQRRQSELAARQRDLRGGAADPQTLAAVQSEFDASFKSIEAGGAPPPRYGESPETYRARLTADLAGFSAPWRRADFYALPPDELRAAGEAVRAAVAKAVDNPAQADFADPNKMRRIDKVDDFTGQRTVEWRGKPFSWMRNFMPHEQFLTRHPGDSTPVFKWLD